MPYGLYISAEGAMAQNQRMQVLANNLANVDTLGFKRELAILQSRDAEAIEQGTESRGSGSINDIGGGVLVAETSTDFSTGPLERTQIPTDMAIDGEGFFEIEKDGEKLLTRAGNFALTADGRLTTQTGYSVMSSGGGPIQIDPSLPWEMNDQGLIQQRGGAQVSVSIVKPASLGDLARAGENMFSSLAETTPVAVNERSVRAGHLEKSGVKPTLEMMELIETSRAFEANIKLIQNQDQMIDSLVSRLLRSN